MALKKKLRSNEDLAKKCVSPVAHPGAGLQSAYGRRSALGLVRLSGLLQPCPSDGRMSPGRAESVASRRESKENSNLIDELRSHIEQLSKTNSSLKTKLGFFKSLHEAESRRRTPYDHIPPRVDTVRTVAESTLTLGS
nr:hypothetical protein HK105_000043 [Polyrhizophydium stewartii]